MNKLFYIVGMIVLLIMIGIIVAVLIGSTALNFNLGYLDRPVSSFEYKEHRI